MVKKKKDDEEPKSVNNHAKKQRESCNTQTLAKTMQKTSLLRNSNHTLLPFFRSTMSSSSLSLSSLLNPIPNPNPNPPFSKPPSFSLLHSRFFKPSPLHFSSQPHREQPSPPLPSEKRSFAVAAGELFIGIGSRLIRGPKSTPAPEVLPDELDMRRSESESENGERIAKAIEDSIEPALLWEQRVKDVEAEKRRQTVTSPGFSFSAAGLLFPYHLGVAQFLLENGFIKETTPLAGSSAGAIVCAVIASGKSMQDALEATKILADDCRLRGTAFRLGAVLRDVLEKVLPDDIHMRCNGRVRVAVTQIVWRPRGLLVDQFDSREDLINALFTSSFIPGYLAPRPATMFRNRLCIDGGLTLFMPPTAASETVRVCAFPASSLRMEGIGISPDCNPENKLTIRQLFNLALEPGEDSMLDKLFEFGYSDAAMWAQENPVTVVQEDIL